MITCFFVVDSIKSSVDGNNAELGTATAGVVGGPMGKVMSKEEEAAAEMFSPWDVPAQYRDRIVWAVCLPLRASAYYTMPNCRLEKWRTWFLVSFFMSMLWISIFSYVMVWMITIIGSSYYYLSFSLCVV